MTVTTKGRPRKANAKRLGVLVKMSATEKALMRERAADARRPLATYLRECGLAGAWRRAG